MFILNLETILPLQKVQEVLSVISPKLTVNQLTTTTYQIRNISTRAMLHDLFSKLRYVSGGTVLTFTVD